MRSVPPNLVISPYFKGFKAVTHLVTMRSLYEIQTLNGEKIVVVNKPEGMAEVREKYSHLPIYSYVEMEAMDGLDVEEQKVLQEAKLVFGGAIYTAENFNKYFPTRKGRKNK